MFLRSDDLNSFKRSLSRLRGNVYKLIFFMVLISTHQPTTAQNSNRTLLSQNSNGAVVSNQIISSDGNWVAYQASGELYTTLISSGIGYSPSRSLGGSAVRDFSFSSDGSRIVFRKNTISSSRYDLYSVLTSGGTPIKLNIALPQTVGVQHFLHSPVSNKVVYSLERFELPYSNPFFDLYIVNLNDGASTKLNGSSDSEGILKDFKFSPDGARVIYRSELLGNTALYSVPIEGGSATKLGNGVILARDTVHISQDSNHVYYIGANKLYSVPIAGGTRIQLNPANISALEFKISVDSESALLLALSPNTFGRPDLFKINLELPGVAVNLSNIANSSSNNGVRNFKLSLDGQYAVYLAGNQSFNTTALYSVALNQSLAPSQFLGRALPTNDFSFGPFEISTKGNKVVYISDAERLGQNELYSIPIEGGTRQKLNGDIVTGPFDFRTGSVTTMKITPDGQHAVYTAFEDQLLVQEIYFVSIDGGDSLRLNSPDSVNELENLRVETGLIITPDSSRLIYRGRHRLPTLIGLYSLCLAKCEVPLLKNTIAPAIDMILQE